MLSILNTVTLLILTVGIVYIQAVPINSTNNTYQCGSNEYYTCGTTCIETCDYTPTLCTADCKYGCFCTDGYVRQSNNTDSHCIEKQFCNTTNTTINCGENEEYNQCGSACPTSCKDLYYAQEPTVCTTQCVPGCFCKQGFYRSESGKCVQPEQCCLGQNEYYSSCGTACPETCNYHPSVCTLQCVQGCFCKPDYIRKDNSTNSLCIKKDEC